MGKMGKKYLNPSGAWSTQARLPSKPNSPVQVELQLQVDLQDHVPNALIFYALERLQPSPRSHPVRNYDAIQPQPNGSKQSISTEKNKTLQIA